jgi:membrane protein involved in colicin uptake
MKLAKVLIFLSACALLAGCSKSSNTNNTGAVVNTTSTTTTTTATPKATVEASKSPLEATTTSAAKVSKPEDAAKGLFEAWKTKDRTAAAKFAANVAITHLFSEGSPEGLQFQGCDKADDGGYSCGYSYEGGALIMHVSGSEADGYRVDSAGFIAD